AILYRRSDPEVHPEQRRREAQRVGHVVAVADKRQRQSTQPALLLTNGQHVCQSLTWVLAVRESVDHRHRGVRSQFGLRLCLEGARSYAVDVAAQDASDVGGRLALAEANLGRRKIDAIASQ